MRTPGKWLLVLVGSAAACTSTEVVFQTGPTGAGGGNTASVTATGTSTTGTGVTTGTGATTGTGFTTGTGGNAASSTGTGAGCNSGNPNVDVDGDGWTPAQGDCNDCDPNVNPGAVDTANGDENCDGILGSPPAACDDNLAVDDADPVDAAKAVELCAKLTDPKKWGLKSATWVLPDGTPPPATAPSSTNYALGHGVLPAFGATVQVQAGKRMLALSSGTARQPTDPGYQDVAGFDKGYTSGSPMGFPKESAACPGVMTGEPHDGVALEVVVVAPTNATGFSFRFNFFTYEWPDYICSIYNDFFVASLAPIPMGQTDGNISTDGMGNPISVNNAFIDVCGCAGNPPAPCTAGGKMFTCGLGDAQLTGTGFGKDAAQATDHGATGWLESSAPVQPHGEITLRWSVYDSSDGVLDTTTLVDDWRWITTPGVVVATKAVP